MSQNEVSARTLLLRIGVSDFSATMIIPYLFTSAMTTDPKSPQIIILVRALQRQLNAMGAGILETGYLDRSTSAALTQLFGTQAWSRWAWFDIISGVIAGAQNGTSLAPVTQTPALAATGDITLFGLDTSTLVTYGAIGAAIYFITKKGKRR